MQTASNIDPEKADTVVQTKNAKNIRPTNSGWGIWEHFMTKKLV